MSRACAKRSVLRGLLALAVSVSVCPQPSYLSERSRGLSCQKFSSGGASRRVALRATLRVLVHSLTSPAGWLEVSLSSLKQKGQKPSQ